MRFGLRGLLFNTRIYALALTLVITLGVGACIEYLYRQAISDAEITVTGLSTILTEQADRALQAIDLIQQNVIDDVVTNGVTDERSFVDFASSYSLNQLLHSRITALPQIDAITIIDQDGKLLNFSRYWPIPNVNIADRDYYQAMIHDPTIDRFVSQPVANRGDGDWTLYLARRIRGPNGQFLGLVLGAVELSYFQNLYTQILPAPDYSFSLFRNDGVLLALAPTEPGMIGHVISSVSAQTAQTAAGGPIIRVKSPVDQKKRLLSIKELAHFPIRFNVSRTVDAALARWHTQVIALVIGAFLLIAGLLSSLWLGMRALRSQDRLVNSEKAQLEAEANARSERAIREHLAHIGTALDNMAQGLCMLDAAGHLVVANQQLARILDLAHVPPVGSGIKLLLRLVLPDRLLSRHETRSLIAHLRRKHARSQPTQLTLILLSGRSILMHMQPTQTDGILLTFSDVTERRLAEAKIAFLANNDTLTSLPNRECILTNLEHILVRRPVDAICAVLSINLMRFREVNDTFGHELGDLLLREIATRVRSFAGDVGLAARIGGDEFAIILPEIDEREHLESIATRLMEDIAVPCELEGLAISVTIRVGIAMAPTDGETAEALLQNAQLAMHFSRLEAVPKPLFFRVGMIGALQARRQMETELLAALHDGDLELHYQPLVRLTSRKVIGFEALLRWRHREHGLVPPNDFIPLAEQTGLIIPIGEWVLRTACFKAMSWPADRNVAVNLSPVQIRDRRLVPMVRAILEETGLAPSRLELEITETVLMSDTVETLAVLHELHHLGVSIALDDFGTGYSSLSYLRSFPFDKVKIDRAFICDLGVNQDARAIVHAIISLCGELGINTLAEGIELDEQADVLTAEGCREGQGFLLGRPTPERNLSPFLQPYDAAAARSLAPLS